MAGRHMVILDALLRKDEEGARQCSCRTRCLTQVQFHGRLQLIYILLERTSEGNVRGNGFINYNLACAEMNSAIYVKSAFKFLESSVVV